MAWRVVTNISEGRSDVDNWNDESRFPRVMSAALGCGAGVEQISHWWMFEK